MSDEKRFDMILGKQRARARLREFIGKHLHARKNAHVLCLPGENGREIEHVYRKLGFRDENILGVERNAAASVGVRAHYPQIRLAVGELLDVCRTYDGVPFSVVSLDYCGNFSAEKLQPLGVLALRNKLADPLVVALNLFAGREQVDAQSSMRIGLARYIGERLSTAERVKFIHGDVDTVNTAVTEAALEEARENVPVRTLLDWVAYIPAEVRACRQLGYTLRDAELPAVGFQNDRLTVTMRTTTSVDEQVTAMFTRAVEQVNVTLTKVMVTAPSDLCTDTAQKLVQSFFDKHGDVQLPQGIERYSYINDAGHRMNSDYVAFRHPQRLTYIPDAISYDVATDTFDLAAYVPRDEFGCTQFVADLMTEYEGLPGMRLSDAAARIDLGGGALPIDSEKMKARIVTLLKKNRTNEEIMAKFPVTAGTLRALRANITMGRT